MERPVRARGEEDPTTRRPSALFRANIWVLTETHDGLDLSPTHSPIHSEHRFATPGGRWTTIWTTLPIIERLVTSDPRRCVAARLDAGAAGEFIVYGTVLPWNGDAGPTMLCRPRAGRDPTGLFLSIDEIGRYSASATRPRRSSSPATSIRTSEASTTTAVRQGERVVGRLALRQSVVVTRLKTLN